MKILHRPAGRVSETNRKGIKRSTQNINLISMSKSSAIPRSRSINQYYCEMSTSTMNRTYSTKMTNEELIRKALDDGLIEKLFIGLQNV
jgi:SRSO17 transposase